MLFRSEPDFLYLGDGLGICDTMEHCQLPHLVSTDEHRLLLPLPLRCIQQRRPEIAARTDLLKAEEVARLYGARWEVEILFKELKSKYALDVVPTSNPQVIEAFIWIAILTLLISRKIYTIIRRLNPGEKVVRFTQLRWGTVFSEKANYLLADVLEYLGLDTSFITSLRISFSEALDPHVNRRRYTEEWWS